MAAEEAVPALDLVPACMIGNAFVTQYYPIQHKTPALVHRFYKDISKFGRPEDDGTMSVTTTVQAINEKVMSLKYEELKAEIQSVDSQHSHEYGVQVFVTGYMTGKDKVEQGFAQTFFLAPQKGGGYFVLNDMFRYVGKPKIPEGENQVLSREVDTQYNAEQVLPNDDPVQDDYVIEQNNVLPKSYASIVKDLKGNSLPFSSPAPAPRRSPIKSQEQQVNIASPAASLIEIIDSIAGILDVESQDGEDGYSVYIKGLPYDATPALLENVFKKFGTIKNGGIHVRSKQGFCFGFVEFEDASAVQNAIEASPILLGGRSAVVEEKRSTNSRGNNLGRFPVGWGVDFWNEGGFRDEDMRGYGNYGGGRGYSQGEFGGWAKFNYSKKQSRRFIKSWRTAD